ncbi:LiaI-LiaF-like domain-containing protein [Bacillus thermotolerans]|uniref:LiaI-LiaF-like transmembrane region domain-containing protein n=1 Tax=Bacillus thermotolerans TaxID=1221996 RepID=A0A0F5ID47_BACTR|nr:DUF5668 domain-containing protein [Bacillus thermotolerans]KKB35112.1 hypothetical protein QY97_01991 [Bacillus thermotolerans]KKB43388.1 hypothetical protein QY95_01633 [Bacillus thermotolerans]KKB43491.1 hypothetical protein QY96_00889 [Bacillus thermotolerans]
MKQQRIFPGVILIGFGLYFFLQQSTFTWLHPFLNWPTLFLIIGLAFLAESYSGREGNAILPGVILTGFGLHFHVVNYLNIWPNDTGVFILIIALGFLLQYTKTKNGLFQGLLFLTLAIIMLFYDTIITWLGLLEGQAFSLWQFWPIVLIVVGGYLLFIKKK